MRHMRFGVIGWGYWGPKISRNLSSLPQSAVTMVADLDAHRLATIAEQDSSNTDDNTL